MIKIALTAAIAYLGMISIGKSNLVEENKSFVDDAFITAASTVENDTMIGDAINAMTDSVVTVLNGESNTFIGDAINKTVDYVNDTYEESKGTFIGDSLHGIVDPVIDFVNQESDMNVEETQGRSR